MEIPPVRYFLLCDYFSTSERDKVNMLGVFDRVVADDVPTVAKRFFVVFAFENLPLGQILVTITNPAGNAIGRAEASVPEIRENRSFQVVIDGLEMKHYGDYRFDLYLDSIKLAETKFLLEKPMKEASI